MLGNNELSIEKACEDYNVSVKSALNKLNRRLDNALSENFNDLDDLGVKIAARANFLEKNPSFLSCIYYEKDQIKPKTLDEFNQYKISIDEHLKRIKQRLQDIETNHSKIFQLVKQNGRETPKVTKEKEEEEVFHDCITDEKKITCIKQNPNFDKVTIQKNAYSEMDLRSEVNPPLRFPVFNDILPLPDVQRRKPQEDLHGKLIQQVVATDSLEGFLKLMDRKPSIKRTTPKIKKQNLKDKYTGSLWFFPSKSSKASLSSTKTLKTSKDSTSINLLVTSSQPCPLSNQERTRKIRQGLTRNKLKYYDLLDDLNYSDLKPIKSEYPRRDNIYPMKLKEAKSYLHRMMQENDKVWKKLIQPIVKKKQTTIQKKNKKENDVKSLMEYLTAPEQKFLDGIPQNLIVMPVKVIYDNFPTKDNVMITDLTKKTEPKVKTNNIQKNIKKTIDVIETKMIDLLSSPADSKNVDAFNVMEKEITNVLKLMNTETDLKKIEKAEKDLPKSPKVIITSPKRTIKRSTVVTFKTEAGGDIKKEDKIVKAKPANIAEGEKLLGQVDNVIKKIDTIYCKLNDDGKCKKEGLNFSQILDELKINLPIIFQYKFYEKTARFYQECKIFHQKRLYYYWKLIEIEKPNKKTEQIAKEIIQLLEKQNEIVTKEVGDIEDELTEVEEALTDFDFPEKTEIIQKNETTETTIGAEDRHDFTLKAFYTLFFSSVFVALNFDYAS